MHHHVNYIIIATQTLIMCVRINVIIILQIKSHSTMESVYKRIPKHCLPREYLPDEYEGTNGKTYKDLTGLYIYCEDPIIITIQYRFEFPSRKGTTV